MFINTGLLKAVDTEAQLAGVMGHEMSRVILRHGTNQASKAQLIELPAVLTQQMATARCSASWPAPASRWVQVVYS